MKKLLVVIIAAMMAVCLLGCQETAFENPQSMAEAALDAICGFGDPEMYMWLTPFEEGSTGYKLVYQAAADMARREKTPDSYSLSNCVNIKDDHEEFNERKELLADFGITNISAMKEYTFLIQYEAVGAAEKEITVCVGKISGKWYALSVINV